MKWVPYHSLRCSAGWNDIKIHMTAVNTKHYIRYGHKIVNNYFSHSLRFLSHTTSKVSVNWWLNYMIRVPEPVYKWQVTRSTPPVSLEDLKIWIPCHKEPTHYRKSQYIFWHNGFFDRDTRWQSWLRHCTTSRKVAGLIPDGVIRIFHWHNPSSRIMALGSTQPLTETSTRNISWGVKAAGE